MPRVPCRRGRPRATQAGAAALLLGLFLSVAALAAVLFLFNAGQLAAHKTRLVDTADAVAWSGGVLQARALNFTAHLNRALIAHEVRVAQAVSLQSWLRLVRSRTVEAQAMPECADRSGAGLVAASLVRFGPDYALMCAVLATPGVAAAVEVAVPAQDALLRAALVAIDLHKTAIQAAQSVVHAPGVMEIARAELLQRVADANAVGDGPVRVEVGGLLAGGVVGLGDDWRGFVRRRDGDDRARLAEVVRAAAHTDPFVRERRWDSESLLPAPGCLLSFSGARDQARRRGGTDLVRLDGWRAEDAESLWQHRSRRGPFGLGGGCQAHESQPVGGGAADTADREPPAPGTAADAPAADGLRFAPARENARAWELHAADAAATRLSGLPTFHDLSPTALDRARGAPVVDLGVRLVRERRDFRTTDGRAAIPVSDRVGRYAWDTAGDEMAAVSAARVYFARPPAHAVNRWSADNPGGGYSEETGSLFNPYWQVRLVDRPGDVAAQRLRQVR